MTEDASFFFDRIFCVTKLFQNNFDRENILFVGKIRTSSFRLTFNFRNIPTSSLISEIQVEPNKCLPKALAFSKCILQPLAQRIQLYERSDVFTVKPKKT